MKIKSDYWKDYEKVFIVKYCIGEVGSLVWHSRGIYKSKKNAVNKKEDFLKKIEKLKGDYFFIFGKDFSYSDLNRTPEENTYIYCNEDIGVANVVVEPNRIEDSFK